jgi:hypothetical protein
MRPPRNFGSAISMSPQPNELKDYSHFLMHHKRLMMQANLTLDAEFVREVRLRGAKNFRDLFDRVPIARGDRHTQKFLDLAEVADRLHLAPIQTQDESVLDRNDL